MHRSGAYCLDVRKNKRTHVVKVIMEAAIMLERWICWSEACPRT